MSSERGRWRDRRDRPVGLFLSPEGFRRPPLRTDPPQRKTVSIPGPVRNHHEPDEIVPIHSETNATLKKETEEIPILIGKSLHHAGGTPPSGRDVNAE
jgi:hypothetical protein